MLLGQYIKKGQLLQTVKSRTGQAKKTFAKKTLHHKTVHKQNHKTENSTP